MNKEEYIEKKQRQLKGSFGVRRELIEQEILIADISWDYSISDWREVKRDWSKRLEIDSDSWQDKAFFRNNLLIQELLQYEEANNRVGS